MSDANSATTHRRPPTWALVLAFALVCVCWGTTYLALKKGVKEEGLPPALFGGVRVCIAGGLILGWQLLRGQRIALPACDRVPLALCALLLFVGGNGMINVAGQTLDSGVSAVLAATTPLWIALFAMLLPAGERLSARGWLGLLLGLAGVLLLCVPVLKNAANLALEIGYVFVLISASCWALGSLVARHRRLTCPHLTAAAYQMILGGACLALVGLVCGETERLPERVTARAAGAFAWLLVVGSLLGFVAYNWLLAHVSAAQVGTYAYVNPAIAVLLGVCDGEELTLWLLGGISVILVGVALVRSDGQAPPANAPDHDLAIDLEPETLPCEPELCRKGVEL
jgi:drug/metabolite transporter (DMT)-like permease